MASITIAFSVTQRAGWLRLFDTTLRVVARCRRRDRRPRRSALHSIWIKQGMHLAAPTHAGAVLTLNPRAIEKSCHKGSFFCGGESGTARCAYSLNEAMPCSGNRARCFASSVFCEKPHDCHPRRASRCVGSHPSAPPKRKGSQPNRCSAGVLFGGESGIRTHGPLRDHWFSRLF